MAEEHTSVVGENMVNANDGTRGAIQEDNTTTTKNSEESNGCPSSSHPAPYRSEYFSTRIAALMERRTEFGTALEREIEASKDAWSELQVFNGADGSSAKKNRKLFRRLQQQYNGPHRFFKDWDDGLRAVGEKIAEGAQGEIFKMRWLLPKHARMNGLLVLKVFKLDGASLQDLQKQWPPGMLKVSASERGFYMCEGSSAITGAYLLKDGRFAFAMLRCWGDLRKVIDIRMEHNGNQAPPFTCHGALRIMNAIAVGMRGLHKDNIVHRDLKASNVLIAVAAGVSLDDFDPITDEIFYPLVADFECSVGVVGTRFWRAPEILLGLKNRNVQPSLFTKKSDVYSYAMTCCEILTGKIPLEDICANDYDAVLNGARPVLPSDIEPWVQSLLQRCWHHDPSKRPSFEHIVDLLKYKMSSGLSKVFKSGPKLLVRKFLRT